jgi:hypothetical protein
MTAFAVWTPLFIKAAAAIHNAREAARRVHCSNSIYNLSGARISVATTPAAKARK